MSTCWIITDGSAGMENQALGLGESLGYEDLVVKRVALRALWRVLSPYFRVGKQFCLKEGSDSLESPLPQLVIACGRQSVLPALWLKQRGGSEIKVIYLQDPRIHPRNFDLVVCPDHDHLSGDNVLSMVGAPHRVTREQLKRGSDQFNNLFSAYLSPRYGVLLGGKNRVYAFGIEEAQHIAHRLSNIQKQRKASLLISPSRRTSSEVLYFFRNFFKDNPSVYIWDSISENPYFGLLAWSDILFLTCDSVSMISEACSTERPVYLIPLRGGSRKFREFHQSLIECGRARWFENEITSFPVRNFTLTEELATELLARGFGPQV